jgi:hypothetical protein
VKAGQVRAVVTTTQIAPTVLTLLGIDTTQLDAVRLEGVKPLPAVTGKTNNGDQGDNGNHGDNGDNNDHGKADGPR